MKKSLVLAVSAWATMCVIVLTTRMPTEVPAAVIEPEPVAELAPIVETVITYPVPLEQELQDFIIQSCEEHHIEPGVVFAIIARESNFQADVIGDSGRSYGLMQVMKRWHGERMERLGVTDLLDPYQNVAVGIDYLAELFDRENGVEWALAAYNAGPSGAHKGRGWSYAEAVLRASDTLVEGVTTTVCYH